MLGIFALVRMLPSVDWPWEPEMGGSWYRLRMMFSIFLMAYTWFCYHIRAWVFGLGGVGLLYLAFPSGA